MRLTPPEPENLEKGFTAENDLFGYRLFAGRLTNLVQNIEEPLVIALDGPWGSGKSVFVKQWAGLLRSRGAAVIEFDSFGRDHCEDAFLALSAEIYTTAKNELDEDKNTTDQFFDKAKRVGSVLLPDLTNATIQWASRRWPILKAFLENISWERIKTAWQSPRDGAIQKVVSERLRQASDERNELKAFRDVLSELAGKLASKKAEEKQTNKADEEQTEDKPFPLIVIIDELDRCRPPFALSIIERVKHMFSVESVCFVFATHLPQLEQIVQGTYGIDADQAHTYLEKFYHLRVMLPETKLRGGQRARYVSHLWDALGITFPDDSDDLAIKVFLTQLAEAHALSLRQLERIITNLVLVSASVGPRAVFIPELVVGLCVMRQLNPAMYEKARKKELTSPEVRDFLRGDKFDWPWWSWTLGGNSPDGEAETLRSLPEDLRRNPQDIIPRMAEHIDALVHGEKSLQELVLENAGTPWASSQ